MATETKKETTKKAAAPKAKAETTAPKAKAVKAKTPAAAPQPIALVPAPTHEEISRRAYEIWTRHGGQHGNPQDDWALAERELKRA